LAYITREQPRQLQLSRSIPEIHRQKRLIDNAVSNVNSYRAYRTQVPVVVSRLAHAIVARGWTPLNAAQRNMISKENRAYGLSATMLRKQYSFPYGSPLLHDNEAAFLYYAMLIFRAHKRIALAHAIERVLNVEFLDSRPIRLLLRYGFLDRRLDGRYPDINGIGSLSPERLPW
ncbi:hypothetical protein PLICRDRAFT_175687, partial [Plicaturopsis crispa FD-325 SS-3]